MIRALLQSLLHYRPASYKTLGKNFIYTCIYRGIAILLGMGGTYFLTRSLSQDLYGSYQFILNVLGICWMFALPGMQNAIMQNVSRGGIPIYKQARNLALICSLLGSLVLLCCSLFYMLANNAVLAHGFLIAALFFPLSKGLQHWRGITFGRENIKELYFNEGFTSIIATSLIIGTCIFFPGNLLPPFCALMAATAVQNILMSHIETKKIKDIGPIDYEYVMYGYKTSFHLAASIASQHLDKILVFTFLSPAHLAIYVAASRFSDIARDAMQDIAVIITPRLAKKEIYTKRLDTIFKITASIYGIILTTCAFTILPWLIVTIFGEQYATSIPYAQALMVSNAIGNFATLQFRYIRSQLDEKGHKESSLYLALTQIALSLALIPAFGLIGVVIASFCNKIALMYYIRRAITRRNIEMTAK